MITGSITARWARPWVVGVYVLAVASVAAMSPSAHAAITFDAASSASAANTAAISWSHTVGAGSNRKLLVGTSAEESDLGGDEFVTSVTYGGAPLTFITAARVTTANNFAERVEIWSLDSPPVGTATVQVNFTGTVRDVNVGAISLVGAQAGTPEATATNTNTDNATITTGITTLTDGAWLIDVVGAGNGGSFTPGAGQTERWDTSSSQNTATGASSTRAVPVAGASSMTQTHSTTSPRTAHLVIAVAPASVPACPVAPPAVDAVSSGSTGGSSITISHTTSGADRLMLVGVSINHEGLEFVTSVTYNGANLTLVGSAAQENDARIEIWRLVAPDTGTHNVVVTFNQNLQTTGIAGVVTFTGVDQTTPLGTFAGAFGNDSTGATVNVPSATGELVFGAVAAESPGSLTVGAGQTDRWNLIVGSAGGAGSTETGASTVTTSWTLGSADDWAIGGVSLKPACSDVPKISSTANQSFTIGAPPTAAATITITDGTGVATITAANDLRIRIPASFNMSWDTSVTSVTIGGAAAGKVSATLLPYEDGGKTVVLDVTSNFVPADQITIDGLQFTSFTASSAADNLELEVNNDGVVSALDDKTITITPPGPTVQPFILSTEGGATLGGLGFQDEDLVEYDPATDIATMFLDGSTVFSGNEDIDAAHVLANGDIVLSTTGGATLGGLNFQDEDLVDYDPIADIATMLFDGSTIFSTNEDIDAVFVRTNGNIILSTEGGAQIGALSFQDEDLVEYDPATGIATLFFDGSTVFSANEDVDGFHILSNGNYLLSTEGGAQIGSLSFNDGDVVEYNPSSGTAVLFFDESNFSAGEDIDAITIDVPPVGVLDHFAIVHDGFGINCQAEPITITAHDSAHNPVVLDTTTTITLTTSSSNGDWTSIIVGSGTLTNLGNGQATYQFNSESSITLALKDTFVEAISINVTDGTSSEDATEDPLLTMERAGFNFLAGAVKNAIGLQIAGKPSDIAPGNQVLEIQAIKTNDDTGACEAALVAANTIDLAFECENPTACTARQVNINGTDITGNDFGAPLSYTGVSLDFGDATDNTATIVMSYPDAGSIQLHARYNIPLDGGAPSGNLMLGASNAFVVRPFAFEVTSPGNPAANNPGGPLFTPAGADFTVTVRAVVWEAADDLNNDGVADGFDDADPSNNVDLSTNLAALNYGQESSVEQVSLGETLDQPSGGTDPGLTGGTTIASFVAGSGSTSTARFNEVGIIELDASVADNDYLGIEAGNPGATADIAGRSGYVGRFVPDRLQVSDNTPDFADACTTGTGFTYLEEEFDYATDPVLTVTALNTGGATTNNYGAAFWKLAGTLTNRAYSDAAGTGASLSWTTNGGAATLADHLDLDGDGTLTISGDGLTYTRPATPEAPFDALVNLSVPVGDLTDSDGVCYDFDNDAICDSYQISGITGTQLRFGRLVIQNAFGSELLALPVPMFSEYFNSTAVGFVVNTDDDCTSFVSADVTLSNFQGNLGAGETTASISGSFSGGKSNLTLTKPAGGDGVYDGSVDLTVDLSAAGTNKPWLTFDWDGDGNHDNDPLGRATFGIYNGSTRHIYLRELY